MQPIAKSAAMHLVLCTTVVAWASMFPIMFLMDMSIDLVSMQYLAFIVGGLAPFLFYSIWRRMIAIPEALVCVIVVFTSAVPILVWTYAAMRVNVPLADDTLMRWDTALGFDWLSFVRFVDAHPWLAATLAYAYSSFAIQLLVLPLLLALAGSPTRAFALCFAHIAVCLFSSVVGICYPSLGAYVTYDVAQGELSHINAWFGYFFLEQFNSVRSDGAFTLVIDKSAGILTFPSVHAATAVICAWAAWPIRALRYPFLALNIAMAVSAISHGSHYLIDVVAGIGMAGFCISLTTLVFYRRAGAHAVPTGTGLSPAST